MNHFYGTKAILARPMSRADYNAYRGWELPSNENGADEGMLVEYIDGGAANHPDHAGYISWSPADVFANAYKASGSMNFGHAVEALKAGQRVAREGWNGKGMFVFLVPGSHFKVNRPPLLGIYAEGTGIDYRPHIDMKTAQGDVVPWVASQSDVLADDWCIVSVAADEQGVGDAAESLPTAVSRLVVAAREVWEEFGVSRDTLDYALEPFASLVPYSNDANGAQLEGQANG